MAVGPGKGEKDQIGAHNTITLTKVCVVRIRRGWGACTRVYTPLQRRECERPLSGCQHRTIPQADTTIERALDVLMLL